MSDSWANGGVDLHLDTSVRAAAEGGDGGARRAGVRAALMAALREAVRSGRLAPGTRLPSSRGLAADLGLARNTVADAYAELVAEGWLTARQGSGTRVAARTSPLPEARPARPARTRTGPVHDLKPGSPDLASFPRAAWLRAARKALTVAPNDAFGYGNGSGRPELRAALADYLARARGVRTSPDQVLVCAGFGQGLRRIAGWLYRRGAREIAVEAYGLDIHWKILTEAGLRVRPLPFDALGTDPTPLGHADAVLLTPGHQFPTGGSLHSDRRAAVVDWARERGALILEDDYDGEFRYDRQPVGALQGLDPDHVVHLGTASKSLAPGLRLGWTVLPHSLAREHRADAYADTGWSVGTTEQLTLAEFLTSGAYDRHVRAMRLRYRRRRDELVTAIAERAPDVRVAGIAAGLHAVLALPEGTEHTVIQAANWQGLALEGLTRFRHPDGDFSGPRVTDGLVVGFGTPPDHAWTGALDALCRVLP